MRSISKTITVMTILSVGLILTTGQIIVDTVITKWLTSQFDAAMESKARAMVTLTKFDGTEVELDFADEFMPEFEAPADPEYFELFLDDGTLLERSHSFDGFPESQFHDQSEEVIITDLRLPDGRLGRQISIKFIPQIENEDEDLEDLLQAQIPLKDRPRVIISLGRERESLNQNRLWFHMLLIGITLLVLLMIVFSVPRLVRSGLQPLFKIKEEISQISSKSINLRVTDQGQPIKIEPIAIQFNLMLDEIERAFKRERQFSSDVAHELRTPVSEIRSLAEVGLRWPDEKDIRTYFGDIHESAQHLDRLIENLLYLCRSEEDNIEIVKNDVNLDKLLADICASLASECESKSITIEPPEAGLPVVIADPQCLEMMLSNLLFNAISHSPREAKVVIESKYTDGFCHIEIQNPMAIPLTDDDVENIFQRFWRKDTARETGRHAGIGLSLVKSYARLLDIDIDAWISNEIFHIALSRIRVSKTSKKS